MTDQLHFYIIEISFWKDKFFVKNNFQKPLKKVKHKSDLYPFKRPDLESWNKISVTKYSRAQSILVILRIKVMC